MSILRRRPPPITIEASIDDMNLTPNAMRVYMYLARREDTDEQALLDPQAMGDHCFSCVSNSPETRNALASESLAELVNEGLAQVFAPNGESDRLAYTLFMPERKGGKI